MDREAIRLAYAEKLRLLIRFREERARANAVLKAVTEAAYARGVSVDQIIDSISQLQAPKR